MTDSSTRAALEEIAGHEHGDALAKLVSTVAFAAADERRTSLADGVGEAAERLELDAEASETSFGNVQRVLEATVGTEAGPASRALLSALLARGVELAPPEEGEPTERVTESLLWLATHTVADAFSALGQPPASELSDDARRFREESWDIVAQLALRVEQGELPHLGRAAALVAAASLREATSLGAATAPPRARAARDTLFAESRDPVVHALLAPTPEGKGEAASVASARGELVAPPRGPVLLLLLSVTGILVVWGLARVAARWLLRLRRSAEVKVTRDGVTIESTTEVFGRTLREQRVHIPVEGLSRAMREVRYPRLPTYAGVGALVLGSYLGVRFFVDGARSGSPELLGFGLLLVLAGLGLDFALSHVLTSAKGRCRLLFVPLKGRALAVAEVDPKLADAALSQLRR